MLTWLDWFVRQRPERVYATFVERNWRIPRTPAGDPDILSALAQTINVALLEYSADPEGFAAREGGPAQAYETSLLSTCLLPFLRGFLPLEDREGEEELAGRGAALGLLLTRDTADLFADAEPPASDPWNLNTFAPPPVGEGLGGVYIDVPHGALRLEPGGRQIRALFAVPWTEPAGNDAETIVRTDDVLVGIVVTVRGAEQMAGLAFAVADSDDVVRTPGLPDGTPVGFMFHPEGVARMTNEDVHELVLSRAVRFLRLVLAYHRHGPPDARTPVRVTPPADFVRNRDRARKGESVFAVTRLAAPIGRLGRPPRPEVAGWNLASRQEVAGHFKLQPHGPGGSLRKLIWVEAYSRGPEGAPLKPQAVRI